MSSAAAHQSSRRPFGSRLADAMDDHGPLCVGIDPHPNLLAAWGLADSAAGLRDFALRTIDAVGGHVAAVKPQSAFFERHGSAGIAVLEETLVALRDLDTLSVLDVKRGDIGSTMAGYAQAYLSDDAPLASDSITVSPYLGYGSLTPALNLAEASGRGVFVLALTSGRSRCPARRQRGPGRGRRHRGGRDRLQRPGQWRRQAWQHRAGHRRHRRRGRERPGNRPAARQWPVAGAGCGRPRRWAGRVGGRFRVGTPSGPGLHLTRSSQSRTLH